MEIVQISYVGSGQTYQDYAIVDESLISSNFITPNFGAPNDYVEFFVYDESGTLIASNYNLESYRPDSIDPQTNLFTALTIDPQSDLESLGINRGVTTVQYNFLRELFNSNLGSQYFIKEISPSRTELRLASVDIGNFDIENGFSSFQTSVSTKNYYNDFYLNFGLNSLVLAVNAAYTEDDTDSYLLVKLYEPLPFDFGLKSQLWIVEKAADSVSYEVNIQIPPEDQIEDFRLRGANFNIKINEKTGQTTPFYSYNSLFSSNITSSAQQLKSFYDDKAIEINVDYTNFENFIHFSSAKERINNFVYKLQLIESYQDQISNLKGYGGGSGTQNVTSGSIVTLQNNINRLVEKLDTYEYYLYFTSESFAWPKYNSTKPYQQVSVTSSLASNWLGSSNVNPTVSTASLLFSASYYDVQNQNRLVNSIPNYLGEDSDNEPYLTFLDMVGQHFDNIWIYYRDVSNRYNAANNPQKGISKDQVADALRSLGVEIYANSTISNNVYFSLFGVNQDGSLLPPTGSEIIAKTVTSSLETLASFEVEKEVYKRLYHNLPYLLKSKGTRRSIRALLSCYGIPESILDVKEFGGYNTTEKIGILEFNDDKIKHYTNPLEISSSFLNPCSTLQYYSNDSYINSTNIEVAFSPSDLFNAHITSSIPSLNLQSLVASPGNLLSSSYEQLNYVYEDYLRDYYVKRFNVWDYIRLVKYYNNSIFRMIKDFVPARSNVSTGILIKDHILHRNKYARHEPEGDKSSNFSQSIDTAFISAYAANSMSGSSTSKSGYFTSSLGYIPFVTTDGIEKYTGDFQGTAIEVTSLNSFNPQIEYSSNASQSLITQSLVALYQNVSKSLKSSKFFDLDYSYQQNVPVNFDLIQTAVSRSNSNNWNNYFSDIYAPFAYVQDYNYSTNAFTVPRYYGSKTQSSQYTYYVQGESGSYGKTAAIDKIKYQFAYLIDIYTASLNLPGRSNSQIKYILDNDQNVLDLTKTNENIFFTQNIFKSQENINVSLFNFDPKNPDVQFLTNKKDLKIYEGGWRYSPVLYFIAGTGNLFYEINPPIAITEPTTYTQGQPTDNYVPHTELSVSDFEQIGEVSPGIQGGISGVFAEFRCTKVFTIAAKLYLVATNEGQTTQTVYLDFPLGNHTATAFFPGFSVSGGRIAAQITVEILQVLQSGTPTSPQTVTSTITRYVSEIQDNDMGTYKGVFAPLTNNSSSIWLSVTQSSNLYYGKVVQNISYENIESPVFPIEFGFGDMIKLKDQKSYANKSSADPEKNFWPESLEYRVVSVEQVLDNSGSLRIQLNLDKPIDLGSTDNVLKSTESERSFPSPISYFIFNKHVPDETNVIIRYDPKSNITQDGILYPQYLPEKIRQEAGNTIKSLKSQNLI